MISSVEVLKMADPNQKIRKEQLLSDLKITAKSKRKPYDYASLCPKPDDMTPELESFKTSLELGTLRAYTVEDMVELVRKLKVPEKIIQDTLVHWNPHWKRMRFVAILRLILQNQRRRNVASDQQLKAICRVMGIPVPSPADWNRKEAIKQIKWRL